MTDDAIAAYGLAKRFGDTVALDSVDLTVPQGTVLGLLGPNGAGKTTAVRILATLQRADAGTARVAGFDVAGQPDEVRRRIGLTGQYAAVDEDLTGRENLVLVARLLDLSRRDAAARAKDLLTEFGLDEAADRRASTYSGGMRRRLDLAASLVGRPSVLFLDEPTTGLDPTKRDDVWATVRRMVSEGTTVLLTTQYLDEAEALADNITVLDHGRVIASGTSQALKEVVGGQSLHVRPADPADLDRVSALLEMVADRAPERPGPGAVAVAVDDDRAMTEVVTLLAREAITVTELSLRLPGLDEVFLSLTGRGVEDATAPDSTPETTPHDRTPEGASA